MLTVALSAVLAGATSFVAIAEWAAATSRARRQRHGAVWVCTAPRGQWTFHPQPSESTIRHCLQRLAPKRLDRLIGAWMCQRTATIGGRRMIAFDGQKLRGARDAAGDLAHLLAGLRPRTGTVLAQLTVGKDERSPC